jgi:2-polyprenyl-3-methyl-5-hydroxy-6-metoxy-1,4-benzoquinol methylase
MSMPVRKDPEDTETVALLDYVDFSSKRVLEIGCGDGRLTWRYAARAAHVVAIDPDADDIAAAIEDQPAALRDRVEFQVNRIEDFAPPQELFDIALLSWSL